MFQPENELPSNTAKFRKSLAFLLLISIFLAKASVYAKQNEPLPDGDEQRKYLIEKMLLIADPLLDALSKNQLREKMPVEAVEGQEEERKKVTYLEAFGRLIGGMAPWLELGPDNTAEGKLRKKYIDLSVKCIKNATDPVSPDFMNFNIGKQPVVDAAFLAHALLRAPNQLWGNLDEQTKENVLNAFKSSRDIKPYYSNWLLFSAMVEAAIYKFEGKADMMRIDYAVKEHQNWYKGDGLYGDGPDFHWDYYNSFVIQPMLLDITEVVLDDEKLYNTFLKREARYAQIQERLISPEGTYPPIGRSLCYRFGAFQSLAQIALLKALPEEVSPEQVRCALYTVIKRQIEAPGTFDENGWLQIGLYGHQPELGEYYISTGSLYLCSQAFLILGLPESDPFWSKPNADWTQKKVWNGGKINIDHALY
ncbi:MAG: hypothetical protein CMO01_09760 [Thalassobius sp.]|nr:hypothetical protein [Thalassovita sp.]